MRNLMCRYLWHAGMSVTLLEYRTLGSGMTGRTTGHIMTWNDDYYYVLQSEHGKETTKVLNSTQHFKGCFGSSVEYSKRFTVMCLPLQFEVFSC